MYLAWLLPLSIIILHNLAVFGLVLKVLCQDKSSQLRNGIYGDMFQKKLLKYQRTSYTFKLRPVVLIYFLSQ